MTEDQRAMNAIFLRFVLQSFQGTSAIAHAPLPRPMVSYSENDQSSQHLLVFIGIWLVQVGLIDFLLQQDDGVAFPVTRSGLNTRQNFRPKLPLCKNSGDGREASKLPSTISKRLFSSRNGATADLLHKHHTRTPTSSNTSSIDPHELKLCVERLMRRRVRAGWVAANREMREQLAKYVEDAETA